MRTIRVSDAVWEHIAQHGKFGEREDDVLRRLFGLASASEATGWSSAAASMHEARSGERSRHARFRMHAAVHSGHLVVQFQGGKEERWKLPDKNDKPAIRRVRDEAVSFALAQGASDPGQTNAVRKALTDAGYHLMR
jgi:hypothetical protein